MAKRLTFDEFNQAIQQRTMPVGKLPDYVDFDPNVPIPKLTFRADALLDQAPPGYDVDAEIYHMLRVLGEERDAQQATFSFVGQKRVVAEGDSWFNLPMIVRPPAIADWIEQNSRFRMRNIAYWGHTLQRILKDQEYLKVLPKVQPEYFIFSAGGNDLQLGLANGNHIHPYDPNRPVDQYLTPAGEQTMAQIEQGYQTLFTQLSQFPKLKVICHGYDYPRPLVNGGQYIGRFLRQKGIPDDRMEAIMVPIINQLNSVIQRVVQTNNAHFLDCRGVTKPYTWYDDMHPDRDGFFALAVKFEEAMV